LRDKEIVCFGPELFNLWHIKEYGPFHFVGLPWMGLLINLPVIFAKLAPKVGRSKKS
jgi:hypothetical protein